MYTLDARKNKFSECVTIPQRTCKSGQNRGKRNTRRSICWNNEEEERLDWTREQEIYVLLESVFFCHCARISLDFRRQLFTASEFLNWEREKERRKDSTRESTIVAEIFSSAKSHCYRARMHHARHDPCQRVSILSVCETADYQVRARFSTIFMPATDRMRPLCADLPVTTELGHDFSFRTRSNQEQSIQLFRLGILYLFELNFLESIKVDWNEL